MEDSGDKVGDFMMQFLRATFTAGLISATAFLVTLVGVLVAIFVLPTSDVALKAWICAVIILVYLVLVLAIRSYQFYMTYARRIRVLRQVQGDGLRGGDSYIAIANPGFLRDNVLLTLYSPTSGAHQCISILRIEKALPGQDILAREFPWAGRTDLSRHFDGRNKTELYVNTLIHVDDLALMLSGPTLDQNVAAMEAITEVEGER